MTQIPVEYLFGSIATLIGIIYLDLRRAVRENTKAGTKRDMVLVKICQKLGIHFEI